MAARSSLEWEHPVGFGITQLLGPSSCSSGGSVGNVQHGTGDPGCSSWLRKTGHCVISVCKEGAVVSAYQRSLAELRGYSWL